MALLRSIRLVLTSLAVPAALGWATPAGACGGFFCSASAPVNQAAERIIFAQDGGTTTQIVEILYEGPSERFAWVLPVPGTPEVAVSSSIVFQRLQQATNPSYTLTNVMPTGCVSQGTPRGNLSNTGSNANFSADAGLVAPPSVSVLDEGSVGPYDFQTIAVDPGDEDAAAVAVRWLTENGYDVDALGGDVLRPYLEAGLNLIAVRLQKGQSTGSIRPLSLTFNADQPSIPIRPTAVAANDDMGVLVWVLGDTRAVPTNYLGLELNEMLIDWTSPGTTYDQVVSLAANEAGGQGFVTELAGASAPLHDAIDSGEDSVDVERYMGRPFFEALVDLTYTYAGYDGFEKVIAEHVTFAGDVSVTDFLSCPDCFRPGDFTLTPDPDAEPMDEATEPDLTPLLDAVQEEVVDPILDAADLFLEYEYVTRLYTTMSAVEMDTDPLFDFNPDLADVSNVHTAIRNLTCQGVGGPWKVTFNDGRVLYGEGFNWPLTPDEDEDLAFNTRILSFKTSGAPTVEVDNQVMIANQLRVLDAGQPNGVDGCSVASRRVAGDRSARAASLLLLLAAALAGRRTRRSRPAVRLQS